MNQRIQELAKQAEDWADSQNFYASDYRDYLMEKFAELIVQECAMLVEGFTIEQEVALDDYREYEAGAVLKEHFGVE